LLRAARESAEIACRSTAGQIEYWAKLGRSLEEGGLTTIDAQRVISRLDFAGVQGGRQQAAASLTAQLLAQHASGALSERVRDVVQANRTQSVATSPVAANQSPAVA
jgi:ParD-like antitoxin of type II bacterial toxin-antitoxin system